MDQETRGIVEGMNASIKGIVDSLRVAATYVPGTVEGSVMDKAAETIETLEAEVREQKNHSIRHLGICELSKENLQLKQTIICQAKELTQWEVKCGQEQASRLHETADLRAEVERLKVEETKLIEDRDHWRDLCRLSSNRERQQREKMEAAQSLVRLAYKTLKQD